MLPGFKRCCLDLKICCLALKYAVWINTAAATGEGNQLSTCNPSGLQQRHLSSAGSSQHQLHSSLSSQGDRTSFRRSPCLSLYKPSDWVPIISKASLVEKYCTVVIFEEGANIIEGISGGDNFTDGNEQEDCNPNEDPGVEA